MNIKAQQALAHIGQFLKDKRQSKKISLKEVSQKTCISSNLLKAIEDGEISKLPVYAYLRGFILAYAREIGAGEKDLLPEIKQLSPETLESSPPPSSAGARLSDTENMVESELHLMPVVAAGCILFVLGGVLVFLNMFRWKDKPEGLDSGEAKSKIEMSAESKANAKGAALIPSSQTLKAADLKKPGAELPKKAAAGQVKALELVVKALEDVEFSFQIDKQKFKTLKLKKDQFEVLKAAAGVLIRTDYSEHLQIFKNGDDLGLLARSPGRAEKFFAK